MIVHRSIAKYLWAAWNRVGSRFHLYLIRSLVYDRHARSIVGAGHDYVRVKTLELCQRRLSDGNGKGSVAELGVYRGNFASVINEVFPDRTLFLFDTFEGFDAGESAFDARRNYLKEEDDFSDTSVERVMRKMKHPGMCKIVKGRFPESARAVEATFSFVSIDADLYLPTKHGLEYFYPRLEHNGYMFVHDYFNDHYKGVREAVDEFCTEHNIQCIPIPDLAGTVVITKTCGPTAAHS